MPISWTSDLSVGVDKIDEQHKVWFEKADELFKAGRERRANEYILELFDYLDDYTKQHFNDEVQYMKSIDYPEIIQQRKAHDSFIKKLADLKEEYNKSGGNILVIINANKMIADWLTNHISTMDRKIGEYAKTLSS